MDGLAIIEQLTKSYATARERLAREVRELNERLEGTKRSRLPQIKAAVAGAAEAESVLHNAIESCPGVFEKPRTYVLHGIKVGFQKGKGGIAWEDDAQVVKLIRKHLAEQFDTLVKVTEKPVKSAVNTLSVEELKRIGCTVIETGDQVLIKATDSEVDRLVNALLRSLIGQASEPDSSQGEAQGGG